MMTEKEYLGDGVYAQFDGYQVWLSVGLHSVIAIDPDVLGRLNDYWARCLRRAARETQSETPEPPT